MRIPRADRDNAAAIMHASLEGLTCGDAFGETFFCHEIEALRRISSRTTSAGIWSLTDDSMMALSVFEVLRHHGEVAQDALAQSFARRYEAHRGYGMAMHRLLKEIGAGFPWRERARALFGGEGTFGNGAAMRVAPLGAFFADDLSRVAHEAHKSAEVTHAHPEAIAGAIAVSLGAAHAVRARITGSCPSPVQFMQAVIVDVPDSAVRQGIARAIELETGTSAESAARVLGSGDNVTAHDTVPYCLWCAAHWLSDYSEALWQTVSGLGDRDTTCAIVGGIVAAYTGAEAIPAAWRAAREPLPAWPFEAPP